MAEIAALVKTYNIEYRCEHCGEGIMRPARYNNKYIDYKTGKFLHYCTKCEQEQWLDKLYPYQSFVCGENEYEDRDRLLGNCKIGN